MYSIGIKNLALSVMLSVLWVVFIAHNGSAHGTFDPKWGDNVSNISTAYLFFKVGFKVNTMAPKEFLSTMPRSDVDSRFLTDLPHEWWFYLPDIGKSTPLFLVTPDYARPYPVAAWFWYLPFTVLLYGFGFSFKSVCFLATFMFMFVAHICFFEYYSILNIRFKPSFWPTWRRVLFYFLILTIYSEFVVWSGQGQYDLIAMFFLIVAMKRMADSNFIDSFWFYVVSLSFHLRGLFCLGLLPFLLFKAFKKKGIKIFLEYKLYIGTILLVSNFYVLKGNLSYLVDRSSFNLNKFHYQNYFQNNLAIRSIYILIILLVCGYFLRMRLWANLLLVLSTTSVLITTRLLRSWYVLFLFPIFLLPTQGVKNLKTLFGVEMVFYILYASTFVTESPFEFELIREVLRCLKRR